MLLNYGVKKYYFNLPDESATSTIEINDDRKRIESISNVLLHSNIENEKERLLKEKQRKKWELNYFYQN